MTKNQVDLILETIANYTLNTEIESTAAYTTAQLCLMDSLGCAILSLKFPACQKLLGPVVPGALLRNGARIPGTDFELDPVCAAFNLGTMIRWLDFNDTWLAAEWGHPSDNFGAIIVLADYLNRNSLHSEKEPFTLKDILTYAIKAYEIQGVLALENSFNRVGLDHVILVRIASTAVAAAMIGCNKAQIINALSNAWIDGGALRTYRHAPNTGSRKSWAAGDATSRAVRLALMAKQDEMGYHSALSAKNWGFEDVLFNSNPLILSQPLNSYVMENILFKVSYPAEFHAQTAVEAAMELHHQVKDKLEIIDLIEISTQEAAMRIINKTGTLKNPADRDHCLQYMIAIPLIFGRLTAEDYEDNIASDPKIDVLRHKMKVKENEQYSIDYLDPNKRAIANSIQIHFSDGTVTDNIEIHYPIGHKNRRDDAIPLIKEKFSRNLATLFDNKKCQKILKKLETGCDQNTLRMDDLMDLFVT